MVDCRRKFINCLTDGERLVAGNLPNNSCMTDGSGYANAALFRKIREALDLPTVPCAVQFRLGGDKVFNSQ
jgi:hypothetical protein